MIVPEMVGTNDSSEGGVVGISAGGVDVEVLSGDVVVPTSSARSGIGNDGASSARRIKSESARCI
jgi:hypothetical protein